MQLLGVIDHRVEAFLKLAQRGGFVHNVHIVEAIIRNAALGHKLKGGIHLQLGASDGIAAVVPRERLRTGSERVAAFGAKRMPVGH
ncbi:hypothetical protein Barb6_00077 [Bacteroidales bacterium Barb6]|nr:hypothetical protein Barb6_00077 [Bacteroidales bacterium Barb6]